MEQIIPPAPKKNSFRLTLNLPYSEPRLDNILLSHMREQDENLKVKLMSRSQLKTLFNKKRILIKGQNAKPSSKIEKGITYVDILL